MNVVLTDFSNKFYSLSIVYPTDEKLLQRLFTGLNASRAAYFLYYFEGRNKTYKLEFIKFSLDLEL